MRKKLYLFPLFILGFLLFATTSCLDGEDDNEEVIDEAWKALNEANFAKVASDNSYTKVVSQSGDGNVYWKESSIIKNTDDENSLRVTVAGKPEFTDTVVVRYEGWYFDKDGKKQIFDSTENPSLRTKIGYTYGVLTSPEPNYNNAKFGVNEVIGGWTTVLQDMILGEERTVCIPQQLGYGRTGSTYNPTSSAPTFTIIPPYTTLWFTIKIFEIVPMKGLSK